MSGFVKKAVVWLGLNEEFPTEDRAIVESPRPDRAGSGSPQPTERPGDRVQPDRPSAVRAIPGNQASPDRTPSGRPNANPLGGGYGDSSVRVIPMDMDPDEQQPVGSVRPVVAAMTTKPQLIVPKSFNDAQQVADAYRDTKPVIVNLQGAERDLARRLIDFSSGLCYGLGGSMERVADQVYLLTPDDVQVSDEERQRLLDGK